MESHRRNFLKSALALGSGLFVPLGPAAAADSSTAPQELNDWVWISPQGEITLGLSQCEVGQGVYTGLPQVLADELDADWQQVKVKFVTDRDAYRSSAAYEPAQQFVGASMSVTLFYERMRVAGAQAREVLMRAGAARLGVRPSQCQTHDGRVLHPATGRSVGYGEIAVDAARLPLNPQPHLKAPSEFRLIGRDLHRLDTVAKVNGSAEFGIDVQVAGMLYGAVRMVPGQTGKIVGIRNEAQVKALPGVVALVLTSQWPKPTLNTVVVVADSYWTAQQAANQLDLDVDPGAAATLTSERILAQRMQALGDDKAVVACKLGDSAAVFAKQGARVISADYHTPYVTHATMEPVCATADFRAGEVEVWGPIQGQDMVREWVSRLFQVPRAKVIVNTTFLGGSFGRKYVPDFVLNAVAASKAVGRPVKVIRSREEDTRHGYYRPGVSGRFKASLGADGLPDALHARVVGQSLYGVIKADKMKAAGGWDETMVESLYDLVYDVPNLTVDATDVKQPIAVSFLRSVGSTSSVFFLESFISELAHAAGIDDYQYRRRLLAGNPLALKVLDSVADAAGWKTAPAEGVYRSMSFNVYTGRGEAFQTVVAMVVELRVHKDGSPDVRRVVCAVDCGRAINPGLIRANIEGGIGFAMTNALKSAITFADGAVQQSNFHDFPLLALAEMPEIEVVILDSDRAPQGCGEVALGPMAPALATALFQATGRRQRSMPFEFGQPREQAPALQND